MMPASATKGATPAESPVFGAAVDELELLVFAVVLLDELELLEFDFVVVVVVLAVVVVAEVVVVVLVVVVVVGVVETGAESPVLNFRGVLYPVALTTIS